MGDDPPRFWDAVNHWHLLVITLFGVATAVLGFVSAQSFNAGGTSADERVAAQERARITVRIGVLESNDVIETNLSTRQGWTNRYNDERLAELAEHVHQLDGRSDTLRTRADVADGRYSVLSDRAQQQPPPPVTPRGAR